jgi:hypothetical protein
VNYGGFHISLPPAFSPGPLHEYFIGRILKDIVMGGGGEKRRKQTGRQIGNRQEPIRQTGWKQISTQLRN